MRARKFPVPGSVRVQVVLLEGAARLYTQRSQYLKAELVSGAIVKFVPDAEQSPEARAAVRQQLLEAGAVYVWTAPAAAGKRAVAKRRAAVAEPAQPPRVIIMRMVDEAHTLDRERLRTVVEDALSKEGA